MQTKFPSFSLQFFKKEKISKSKNSHKELRNFELIIHPFIAKVRSLS